MRITIRSDVDTIVVTDGPGHGGCKLLKNGLTGWLGAVKPREEAVDRVQSDGMIPPARLTSGGRTVSISAAVYGLSSVETAMLRDRITNLMGRWLVLTVADASGPRHAQCWMADDPEPSMLRRERAFKFTLILYCPDPYKYGEPVSFVQSGSWLTVTNTGMLPVLPRISVEGPVAALSLALGSHSISWTGSADVLTLDFNDMIPSTGSVGVDDAFAIPPGVSRLQVTGTVGARTTMTISPAWR